MRWSGWEVGRKGVGEMEWVGGREEGSEWVGGREKDVAVIQMWIHCTHLDKRRQLIYFLRLNYAPSQTSTEVDLSDLGLLALYSEIHPTISYIVHYGVRAVTRGGSLGADEPPSSQERTFPEGHRLRVAVAV